MYLPTKKCEINRSRAVEIFFMKLFRSILFMSEQNVVVHKNNNGTIILYYNNSGTRRYIPNNVL